MAGDTAGHARGQGPGAELSHERERQGLTQQQVAEQLNLDVSVIDWMEQDDFAALGAPVFAKGHLRRYAALLGLPPERMIEAYEQTASHPSQPTLIPKAREEHVPPRRPPRWPWVLGGVAVALALAALVPWVIERWSQRVTASAPSTAAVEPGQVDSSPDVSPPTPAPQSADSPATAAESPADAVAAAPGQVALRLTFSEDTWVEVYDSSGVPVLYDLGSSGTERVVRATAPLSVTIGDPKSVVVYANGRRLAVPPAPSGHSLTRFTIDAAGAVR